MAMDERLPGSRIGKAPKARFRCLPCQRFTQATEAGVCPRCGWAPPVVVDRGRRPDPRVWARVNPAPRAWPLILGCTAAFTAVAVALWLAS